LELEGTYISNRLSFVAQFLHKAYVSERYNTKNYWIPDTNTKPQPGSQAFSAFAFSPALRREGKKLRERRLDGTGTLPW